jgi:hypothetical protein
MLFSMVKQVLTQLSLVVGLTKHLLAHDRQRASDTSLVVIFTTPIHRWI